jgi:hypothetical protein
MLYLYGYIGYLVARREREAATAAISTTSAESSIREREEIKCGNLGLRTA